MITIIVGSIILSLLHASIPNHWLPVIAIGRKEGWSQAEVLKVTFAAAVAHGLSTIIIGVILSLLGSSLAEHLRLFTHWIGPLILILLGIVFIYRHHVHKHFHAVEGIEKRTNKKQIVLALVIAMFFSPCMEIEAYFLMAGTYNKWLVWFIASIYLVITVAGMLLLVKYAYLGLLKLNWHRLEHSAGIVTGITLVLTGIISFFIS